MTKGAISLAVLVVLTALLFTGDSATRSIQVEALLNDAVQEAISDALYQQVPLLDIQVDFPRPTAEAEERLSRLAAEPGSDPHILLELAHVQVRLLNLEEAEGTMRRLADTHPDRQAGLRELAHFYHGRLQVEEEVRTLLRLADLQEGKEEISTFRRILVLLDDYLLEGFDREPLLRSMIAAQPDEPRHVEALISHLAGQGRRQQAFSEAEAGLRRFPDRRRNFISLKAEILLEEGKAEEALALYRIPFDPVDGLGLFSDYLALLRELDRYRDYERGLRRNARLNTLGEQGRREYFLLMRSQRRYDDSERALDDWVLLTGDLSEAHLRSFAAAYAAIGKTRAAWRLEYTLYVRASSKDAREDALLRLFDLTWDLKGPRQNLTGRGIGTHMRPRHFDTGPGVVGGLLSLLYNMQGVPEKLEDLERVSRDYENRGLLMRIFEQFRSDHPRSPGLAKMYALAVRMFNEYNQPRTAVRYAVRFMDAFPDDERFYAVAEEAVAGYKRLAQHDKIRDLYVDLMRRADRRGERDSYLKYLSSLVQHFVGRRDNAGAIESYWNEINAHPNDEALYERFLEFLSRYRIYDEKLKVYQRAVEHFGKSGYYHKLARWYIRQRRTADFQDLTRKIADIFSDSELSEFFDSFLKSGRNVSDPDSIFFRTLYEYANRRFPRRLRFVEGLLDFYRRFALWPEFDRMSKRYFYATESIRKGWLKSLSRRGLLDRTLQRLTGGGGPALGTERGLNAAHLPQSPAELLLLAEGARWNSLFEAAAPLYARLAELYPGDEQIAAPLASLERSFGRSARAEELYARLARILPRNKKYPTEAGEVLVETGNVPEAARHWLRIVEIKPSDPDLYLEVASIFWDYYQFDRAADLLLAGRRRLGEPTLFGSKLAAVYESAKDYPKAIAEYVRTAALNWERSYERAELLKRLVFLAKLKGMAANVESAFAAATAAEEDDHRYSQAYAEYLKSLGEEVRRGELLRASIDRYNNRSFLGWLAELFRREGEAAAEEKTLRRLIDLSGEDSENLLALANFMERQGRLGEAESVLLRRVEMNRTDEPEALSDYLAALDEAARFAWRHDRFDSALGWWNTAARAASGPRRTARLHALSQRYIQRGRYQEASAVLEELLSREPSSAVYFNTLAKIYSEREDYPGLAALYRRAIEAVKADPGLGSTAKTERISALRLGLIDNLVRLGDFTAALDQHIEIINRQFDAEGMVATAYRFAGRHGLVERLVAYYRNTSEKSFKDFRWNSVLANLFELQNRLPGAAEQWRMAIRNEPQRIELHASLAEVLLKLQRYADAVETYRQIYRLDYRNSGWLLTIARTQALAGDLEAARGTLDDILGGGPPGYRKYFEVARVLEEWGELGAAGEKLDAGLAELRSDIYRQKLTGEDLELYVRAGVKMGRVVETFNTLLDLNSIYTREATRRGNERSWEARQGQRITFAAFGGSFAVALKEFAGNAQRREVAQRLEGYLDQFPENIDTVRFVRNAAERMGFAEITGRAIQLYLQKLNSHNQRYTYRGAIMDALDYYAERGQWREAAGMLERELSRSTLYHFRGEVFSRLTELYRYAGDVEGEIEALRNYLSGTGGTELGLARSDPKVERYLTLLLEGGRERELKETARTANAYSGQVINFFLARKRPDLAALAVDAASLRRSPKWRDSKKLLIQTYGGSPEAQLGARSPAAELMDMRPIAERLTKRPDRQRVLVGDEWFGFAGHFAVYLHSIAADSRFRGFAVAPAEWQPRNDEMQRTVGSWYARRGLYEDALRHYQLALQLEGDVAGTYTELGELHIKRGDREEAMRAWRKMIEGDAGPVTHGRFFGVLARNGFRLEATRAVMAYLQRALPESFSYQLRELIWKVVADIKEKEELDLAVSAFTSVAPGMDEPIEFLRYILDDLSLPPEARVPVYGRIIALAAENEETEEEAGERINTVLRYWLEQAIEFAVKDGLHEDARGWIKHYESNGFHENRSGYFSRDGRYWQLKGRALLALGDKGAALEALRNVRETDPPRLGGFQVVHAILLDGGLREEAESLMIGYYRDALSRGDEAAGNYSGLAAILLDRAERASTEKKQRLVDEAAALLDRMVNLEANNKEGMRKAASLLERRGLHSLAVRYRRMLHRLDPLDHESNLALALDEAALGERGRALELLRELLTEPQVPRSVRLPAREPYLLLFEGRPDMAGEEITIFSERKNLSEIDLSLYAELARFAGRAEEFAETIETGLSDFFEPSLIAERKAEIALDDGDTEAALELLRLALRNGPRPGTRRAFFDTLISAGRRLQALQLLDPYRNYGFLPRETGEVAKLFGFEDEEPDLLDFYGTLVKTAMAAGLYDAAELFERQRIELAGGLKVEIGDRLEEIEELQRQQQPPEPPVRIVDEIANRATTER